MRSGNGPAFEDIWTYIGHGLTSRYARPRHLSADVRCVPYQHIPAPTGLSNVLGFKRDTDTAGGVVVAVDRVVAPPGAVVVPDVVVGVRTMCVHAPTSTEGVGHPLS
jgi:hypothetical protein